MAEQETIARLSQNLCYWPIACIHDALLWAARIE